MNSPKNRRALCWGLLAWSSAIAGSVVAEPVPQEVTVLAQGQTHLLADAMVDRATDPIGVWIPADQLELLTGYQFKPEGLCRGDLCIPVTRSAMPWHQTRGAQTYLLLNALAQPLQMAVALEPTTATVALGRAWSGEDQPLTRGLAPDVAALDRTGQEVRLSSFRGKKVLLLAWASWCACSKDLPGWEAFYRELDDRNFEIVAVAQDTGGEAVAGPYYDAAKASFVTLVDPQHAVSSAFKMVNVPTGVWIDESGHVVRPPEVAYSRRLTILGQSIGDDRYAQAVRDWVERGESSRYLADRERLQSALRPPTPEERLADAEFQLGAYFYRLDQKELARQHCAVAQRLCPENWNYHRQDWAFNGSESIVKWLAKVRQLGDKPYYEPALFPDDSPSAPDDRPRETIDR